MWRVSHSHRPEGVNTRTTFRHWESGSIVGGSNAGGIHTSVESKSRFLCAVKIPAITGVNTLEAQHRMFAGLPAHAVASVSADSGSKFAHHYTLADTLGIHTYFCDPYSSWQRGTNEHFNARIRKCYRRRRGLMTSPRANSMSSWQRSITGSEESWAGSPRQKYFRNYARKDPPVDALHFPLESADGCLLPIQY